VRPSREDRVKLPFGPGSELQALFNRRKVERQSTREKLTGI